MYTFPFDKDKAVHSMLYISKELGDCMCDKYTLIKILYFADQNHIAQYGRPITGDNMVALQYGPVPSNSLHILNSDNEDFELKNNRTIQALSEPDLDYLSESDIECLNEAIHDNKDLDFGQLKAKSHDAAYDWTIAHLGKNKTIPYKEIAKAKGASPEMLNYIDLILENTCFSLNE